MAKASAPEKVERLNSSLETLPAEFQTSDVVVVCWGAPTESDRRARKIAQFLGATVEFASLTGDLERITSTGRLLPRCACLIVQAETLARISDERPDGDLRSLLEQSDHVFMYDFQPQERHDRLLQTLASGKLVGTRPCSEGDAQIRVAAGHPEWCFQFSGLSVGEANPAREGFFIEGNALGAEAALIRIGKQPFFVRVEGGASHLFFLATGEFADLDEKVPRNGKALQWFCGLAPLLMFLRGALKEQVWHNDHSRACFIIDDPLLKGRHGFLDYERLFDSMQRQRFSACIAFIPWNYRRSSRKVAELFSANRDAVFLCVHGCDHTDAEFESRDFEFLRGQASEAIERMQLHRQLSGVPFDEVMVFPQGLFSAEAMAALKASGYVAAVNTELAPSTTPEALVLRDLLDVAVTRFANFPIFGRRYPKDQAEFAFDLFLGKPVLVVEHHSYFRDGHVALEAFIAGLNGLDIKIQWTGLEAICSRACLSKSLKNGNLQVRFYTSRFHLENDTGRSQTYELLRGWPAEEAVPSVTINGHQQDCVRDENSVKIRTALGPGQSAEVRVHAIGSGNVKKAASYTLAHNMSVGLRRLLCEVRDNYVDTNPVARRFLAGVK